MAGGSATVKRGAERQPATLRDVALAADVSVATVSRALNTPDALAPDTLSRVRAAISETGYIPTLMSAGNATNRSRLVAVLMSQGPLQVFEPTFRAITNLLNEHGYQAMLMLVPATEPERDVAFGQIFARRPEGLVCIGIAPSTIPAVIRAKGIPIVEVWQIPSTPVDMVAGVRHAEIGAALGEFVLHKGWRRPLLVQYRGTQAFDRRFGLTRTLVEAGRDEPLLSATYDTPGSLGDGRAALASAIEAGTTPDVAICMSDWLALGVLVEAKERGIRVPDSLAIIGYGGFDFAAGMTPPITTVVVDGERIGREAAGMLILRMAGQDPGEKVRDIGFRIEERGTT